MRIGMVLDKPFPPDPRVENEAKLLIEDGYEVHLFSYWEKGLPAFEVTDGIKVHRYKVSKLGHKLSALAYTVPLFRELMKPKLSNFIERHRLDTLHVHDMVIAEAVFMANEEYKLPFILDLHENRPEIMRMYRHVQQFPGNILINLDTWKRKQNEFIQRADRVVLVTPEAKQQAVLDAQVDPEKIYVVPNTVDPETFCNYPLKKEIIQKFKSFFTLVYVGDTSLRRGTDTAIKAVSLLKERIPEIRLILVGNSSGDADLKKLVEKLSIENHVYFEGWQEPSLFPSYIAASEAGLSPLKRNLHHDTTYANKLFQYMAMGRAVVASDCIAQANLVERENCGLIHIAGDEKSLAKQILQLYQNPKLRLQLAKNGKEAVRQKYDWKNIGRSLYKVYEGME